MTVAELSKKAPEGTRLTFVSRSIYGTSSHSSVKAWRDVYDARSDSVFHVGVNGSVGLVLEPVSKELAYLYVSWPNDSDIDADGDKFSIKTSATERLTFRFL